jgi:hypothetical protein
MRISKQPILILGVLIGFKAIQIIYSFAVGESPTYLSQVRFAEFIIITLVAFYAVRGRIVAIWAMGIYLLIQVVVVLWASFIIPIEHYAFKILSILLSSYFIFGGFVFIQLARVKKKTVA